MHRERSRPFRVAPWSALRCARGAEAAGNLILNASQEELDGRLTAAYLSGLREAGWTGDERVVRLGICASAVRYDWLTPYCLEHTGADLAGHAAALALCARWADEVERLAL